MLKAQKIVLQVPVYLQGDSSLEARARCEVKDIASILAMVEAEGGAVGEVEILSADTVEDDDAAAQITGAGGDVETFVTGIDLTPLQEFVEVDRSGARVIATVDPAHAAPEIDGEVVVFVSRYLPDVEGWKASWGTRGGSLNEIPDAHPSEEDAMTDARRRHAASTDLEAQADEFEDTVASDAFDAGIHYGAIFIDDENRWRGRWYRDEWTGEGEYTDNLYDTPGQARRAAKRLRTTGDEQ